MIKLIIFDIGGVIDTFYERQYISYITKKLGISEAEFRSTLIPILKKSEVGQMSVKEIEQAVARRFRIRTSQLEWNSSFKRLNRLNLDVVSLVQRLSRHYTIVLLTNVSRSRQTVKMQTILKKVKYDRIFASCYLKMAKPDPRIYRLVLRKMKVKPSEAIFIDDREINVVGARKVGITAIQFLGYASLVKKLKILGIRQ